jgi:hypothetical protein
MSLNNVRYFCHFIFKQRYIAGSAYITSTKNADRDKNAFKPLEGKSVVRCKYSQLTAHNRRALSVLFIKLYTVKISMKREDNLLFLLVKY